MAEAPGIHLLHARCEDDVDALGGTHLEVGVEGAGIAVEVLGRGELHRVDEDADHDRAGRGRARGAHQAGVAVVQGAHGRHEGDLLRAPAGADEQRRELLAGVREDRRGAHRLVSLVRRLVERGRDPVEHPQHLGRADREQSAVGHGAVEGGARHRDVRRQRLRRVGDQVGEVGADRLDVTTHDRAGERGVTVLERVVEGCGEQRAQGRRGVLGTGGGEDLHRLGDQRDEVVGAVGQACVVERAAVLGHPHRATAEVGDERLGELAIGLVGRHAEDATGQPRQVDRRCR